MIEWDGEEVGESVQAEGNDALTDWFMLVFGKWHNTVKTIIFN